ncbi:expressed unknown protein [Ectocarpus siliculosus]|uniref:Uncharacterized protein n=1 Tax=Ectocarpus siliculosus TaxID=2880 RepID=D7FMH6_ECTSI|nr:expressed unknown protein [Ectocarpus siliculosus]|eukprot:CBJ25873.1 expressed unknown protein [Ectocarpus siliculosus]
MPVVLVDLAGDSEGTRANVGRERGQTPPTRTLARVVPETPGNIGSAHQRI